MQLDPPTISVIALFTSMAMGLFTIYTFKQKAGVDEVEKLRSRVKELEAALVASENERTRLARENYRLMADLLGGGGGGDRRKA